MLYEARFVRTQCGRPTRKLLLGKLLKRSGDGLLTTMRPERSGPRLFEQACKMGWKGWFRSIGSAPMEPADRCIGSRSKTPSRPAWLAPRTGHGDLRSEGHFGANAPNGRSRPPGLLPENYKCAHLANISGDNWRTMVRLSDVEPCFVSQWCGERAPIRLDHADSNRHQLRAKPSFERFRSVCPRPSRLLQRGPELPAFLAREDQSPPVSSHFSHGR